MRLSFTRIYFVSCGSFWDRKFSANCWMSNISETNNFVKGIHSDCQVDRYGILNKGLWGNLGFYNLVITTSKEHVQSWSHGSVLMIYVYMIASKRIKQGWRPKCPSHPNPGYGICSEITPEKNFEMCESRYPNGLGNTNLWAKSMRKEKGESALLPMSTGVQLWLRFWVMSLCTFLFLVWKKNLVKRKRRIGP